MSEVKTFDVDGTEFEVWENTSGNGEYVLYEDYATLKAERDALANENLAIKAKIAIHAGGFSVCPVCSHEEPSETDDVVWMVNETPTPATDAYANQLRAEGAASVGTLIRACAHEFPDSAEDIVEECAMIADNRAINLCKENSNDY